MLKIGKLTDYALIIMSELARLPEQVISAATLAEALHLKSPTVSKILKILAEAGLVASTRGADGGYSLAKSPEKILLTDVITCMEGSFALTECCENTHSCGIYSSCTMRGNWYAINSMVHTFLSSFSIVDMLKPISINTAGIFPHGK